MAQKRRVLADIDPNKPIPIALAGQVIGKGKSTIYEWIARGILRAEEGLDGMTVTPAQVRAAEATVKRGRPRADAPSPAPDNAGNVG